MLDSIREILFPSVSESTFVILTILPVILSFIKETVFSISLSGVSGSTKSFTTAKNPALLETRLIGEL